MKKLMLAAIAAGSLAMVATVAAPAWAAPVRKKAAVPAAKAPAPAPRAPELPIFEFKGVRAGETVDHTILRECTNVKGEEECSVRDGSVAGLNSLVPPTIYLYGGKLTTMLYLFPNKNLEFSTIAAALTAKYGEPCNRETKVWESRGGIKTDNAVLTWCFKTGQLKLTALSVSRDYGDLLYVDSVNKAPTEAPKVDF